MSRKIMAILPRKALIILTGLMLVVLASFAVFTVSPAKSASANSGCPATIRYGSTGDQVKQLQNMLNARYNKSSANDGFTASPYKFNYPLKVDGIFGPQTQAAVKDYQSARHLQVDGIVGRHTWLALGFTPGCK